MEHNPRVILADSCAEVDFPDAWRAPADVVLAHDWGVGIAPIDSATTEAAASSLGVEWIALQAHHTGGGWYSSALAGSDEFPSGFVDGGLMVARATDDAETIVVDPATALPVLLTTEELHRSPAPVPGAYSFTGSRVVSPAETLLGAVAP